MRHLNFRLVPVLAIAAMALVGCERATSFSAPSATADQNGFHTAAKVGHIITKAREPGKFGTLSEDNATATIGPEGGQINVASEVLVVPAGTVDAPTVFSMTIASDDEWHVSLTATSADAPEGSNDIGHAGFKSPVYLYYDLGYTPDPDYSVGWASAFGLVPIPTRLEGTFVIGELSHFSDYHLLDQ